MKKIISFIKWPFIIVTLCLFWIVLALINAKDAGAEYSGINGLFIAFGGATIFATYLIAYKGNLDWYYYFVGLTVYCLFGLIDHLVLKMDFGNSFVDMI